MRQTFDEATDPSFGPRHTPLIRKAMAEQALDGFLIPHEDEHQNEYLPAANDRLAWATGFTGSAGAAVILKDRPRRSSSMAATPCRCATRSMAACSRCAISSRAASRPISAKRPDPAGPSATTPACTAPTRWVACASPPSKAGAASEARRGQSAGSGLGRRRARPSRRPPVVPHPLEYAGEDSADKRARIGEALAEKGQPRP